MSPSSRAIIMSKKIIQKITHRIHSAKTTATIYQLSSLHQCRLSPSSGRPLSSQASFIELYTLSLGRGMGKRSRLEGFYNFPHSFA